MCERLIAARADVNGRDKNGRTPLHKCAFYNSNSDILKLLYENGANPDLVDDEENTPLHFAARRGKKVAAQYLI